ncbi:MAG: conjugal transfer protein TraC, partial [Acidobacteria bacterium]
MKLFGKKKQKQEKEINFQAALQQKQMDVLDEEEVYLKGLARVLDLIAPSAIGINPSYLQIGSVYCRTIFVATYPNSLSMGWLNRIIGVEIPTDVSLFIHPVNTNSVLKKLRKKSTQIQSEMNIEQERGITRDPVLEMAFSNVEQLRDRLQEGSEKFFSFGLYFNIFGESLDELEKNSAFLESLLNTRSMYAKKAIFRAKEGFTSCIPLGKDELLNTTALNTSPLSTAFPFVSADVTSGQGILYGINMHNNSLVLFDRFSMENANMVVFAKSGAGKSYAVKLEMLRALMLGTSGIIIDPENEYEYLAKAVGGTFINISLTSDQHLNPFDLPFRQGAEMVDILRSNIADLIGLFKLMFGAMTPEEEATLENAIRETYAVRDINENTSVEDLDKKAYPLMDD